MDWKWKSVLFILVAVERNSFNCSLTVHWRRRQTNKMVGQLNINFAEAISYIFYVTKFFGLIPYSFPTYRKHKILVSSVLGNIQSIISLGGYIFFYHYIVSQTYFDGKSFDSGKVFDSGIFAK